jgi:predicted lipoprotein with Yx(FWY)xxD motif
MRKLLGYVALFAVFLLALQPMLAGAAGTNYSVNVAYNPTVGNYLTNSTGWSLYMYTPDKPNSGNSSCYGGCATAWPPFYAGSNLTLPSSLKASNFGTINRTGGGKQTTYLGSPLYYYAYDTSAGDISGQNVGHIWFLMSPAGIIMPATSTVPTTTTPTTISTSSGNGSVSSLHNGTVQSSPNGISNNDLYIAGAVVAIIVIIGAVAYMKRKG